VTGEIRAVDDQREHGSAVSSKSSTVCILTPGFRRPVAAVVELESGRRLDASLYEKLGD
jgi:hypothetical protein